MITLERKITVPADRRLNLNWDLPDTVPVGQVEVVFIIKAPQEELPAPAHKLSPSLRRAMDEATRKYEERKAIGRKAFEGLRGCLADVYTEDGAVIQRRWHEEWDREKPYSYHKE